MVFADLPQRLLDGRDSMLELTPDVVQLRPSWDRFPPIAARREQLLRLPKSALPHAEVGQRRPRHHTVEKETVPTGGQAEGQRRLRVIPATDLAEEAAVRRLAGRKQYGCLLVARRNAHLIKHPEPGVGTGKITDPFAGG